MAKLDQSVDRAGRLAPVQAKMATKFGGKSVTDDQGIGVETVRREMSELVLPQPNGAPRSHFMGDKAQRGDRIAVHPAICQPAPGIVFEVEAPDFGEG